MEGKLNVFYFSRMRNFLNKQSFFCEMNENIEQLMYRNIREPDKLGYSAQHILFIRNAECSEKPIKGEVDGQRNVCYFSSSRYFIFPEC